MKNSTAWILVLVYFLIGCLIGMLFTYKYMIEYEEEARPYIAPYETEPTYYYLPITDDGLQNDIHIYIDGEYKDTGQKMNDIKVFDPGKSYPEGLTTITINNEK